MSNLIELNEKNLDNLASSLKEDVIHGLSKGSFGFIISAPDMGKGFFCLSVGYEVSTGVGLFGIGIGKPLKVLYWPIEDGVNRVAQRIKSHLSEMPVEMRLAINKNMSIWAGDDPICCNDATQNTTIGNMSSKAREELISASKDFDLLIIDTIREAVGNCHEVKDDYRVKVTLQEIAKKADVAILATHHLTKEGARGNEKISSVSGSGFSETMANSRYQLYLNKKSVGRSKVEFLYLSHIKNNYVAPEQKITEMKLDWSKANLLTSKDFDIKYGLGNAIPDLDQYDEFFGVPRAIEEQEAKVLLIDEAKLSEYSKQKAKEALKDSKVIDEDTLSEYAVFLNKKKNEHDQK
jgi:RecA-family ATPase